MRNPKLLHLFLLLWWSFSAGTVFSQVFHPKGTKLESLCVITNANLPNAVDQVLVATLQGLVAKTSSEQIYINEGGPGENWMNDLQSNHGITLTTYSSWTTLLSHFQGKVTGYILYDKAGNNRSVTAATSLCGPMNAIAVDVSQEATVRSLGITTLKADVRGKDEKWVYQNYKGLLNKQMAAELNPDINGHLRDYITLTNSFAFYDGNTDWRKSVLQALNPEAFCFGYGQDEWTFVSQAANQGVVMLPSDVAKNLAPLSSIYEGNLKQNTFTTPTAENNVHYVTFVASDGDNVAFNLWSQHGYFTNPNRGSFNMGYTISPSLIDLAPSVLRWYYENASNGTAKDFFIAGPSGSGYTYPSQMPAARLDTYLDRLNTFMGTAGLNISNILDNNAVARMDLWNKYLAKPNIDALIYSGYGEDPAGRIYFSDNGKPFIEQRDILWQGLEEEAELIDRINSRSTNPHSPAAYTLVYVHVWTKDLSSIKTVVEGLNPNVRVVTPDAFVKLVRKNLKGKVDKPSTPYSGSPIAISNGKGTIQAEDFDKGGEGAGYHDTNSTSTGGEYRPDDAVDIMKEGANYYVAHTAAGEWTNYAVSVGATGTYNLTFRVKTTKANQKLALDMDYENVTRSVSIPHTKGIWQDVVVKNIPINRGKHELKLHWETGNVDVDYLSFQATHITIALTPYLQINGGSWQNTNQATLCAGANVIIGPQPNDDTGWTWNGPNGFTATTREITLANMQAADAGTYTATYANNGSSGTLNFEISFAPISITPYILIQGSWLQTATGSVNKGESVSFGPQPNDDTGWTWTGPDGFTTSSREFTVALNQAGTFTYTATYTSGGCTASQDFIITVEDVLSNMAARETLNTDIKAYPNTASDVVFLDLNSPENLPAHLTISDLQGRVIKEVQLTEHMHYPLTTSEMKNGLYLLILKTPNMRVTKRLLISR